jgi:hypothetical protein
MGNNGSNCLAIKYTGYDARSECHAARTTGTNCLIATIVKRRFAVVIYI